MVKKTLIACTLIALTSSSLPAKVASILDIKHSITNDNIVPPESFETKTRELEENFYLKNYVDNTYSDDKPKFGTDKEYEDLLSRLPVVVEMPYNSIVGKFINMYLGKRRRLVSDMLALHSYYGPIFIDALEREGLPMELQYLPVIESAINPNAVSRAGAAGLWQFMPSTATGLGMEVNSLVDQRRDPYMSSRQAARYFKQLYDIYEDWSLAIAAYNCGPGRVNQALRRAGGGKKDFWEIYQYLPHETRDYVPAFIAANFVMNYHDKYGINPTVVKRPLVTDRVAVNDRIHFQQIADVLNIPIDEIRMLNPQFRKDIIPGNNHTYNIILPKQQCLSFIMSEDQIKAYNAEDFAVRTHVEPGESRYKSDSETDVAQAIGQGQEQAAMAETVNTVSKTHVVSRGENLRDIAKKYGVSATDIKHWNHLRRGKVKEGDNLIINVPVRQTANNASAPRKKAGADSGRNQSGNSSVTSKNTSDGYTAHADRSRYQGSNKSTRAKASSSRDDDRSRYKASRKSKSSKKTHAKPKNHKVTKGESLEKIARKTGVSVEELRAANGMSKGSSLIREGQTLKIPAKGSAGRSSVKSSSKGKNKGKSVKSSNSKKKSSSASKSSRKSKKRKK